MGLLSRYVPHLKLAFSLFMLKLKGINHYNTTQFELCLAHIFAKYCTPKPSPVSPPSLPSSSPSQSGTQLLSPPEGAYLTAEGLDEWARDTNGAELSGEEKEEIGEYMDVTEDGCLT